MESCKLIESLVEYYLSSLEDSFDEAKQYSSSRRTYNDISKHIVFCYFQGCIRNPKDIGKSIKSYIKFSKKGGGYSATEVSIFNLLSRNRRGIFKVAKLNP